MLFLRLFNGDAPLNVSENNSASATRRTTYQFGPLRTEISLFQRTQLISCSLDDGRGAKFRKLCVFKLQTKEKNVQEHATV
jgi:hypothetical protein